MRLLVIMFLCSLLVTCSHVDRYCEDYGIVDSVWMHKRGESTLQFENVYFFRVNGLVAARKKPVFVGDTVVINYIRKSL